MMTRRQQTSVDEVRPEGLWTKTNNKTVYYADCEKYSFAMSHTYMFPSFMRRFGKGGHYMGPGYSLPGTLYNHDNKPLQKYSAYSERGTSSQREFTAHLPQFSLAQLMSAAGMSTLDEQHDLISESSYRFRGAVLVVELTYSNLAVGKIYPFVERQWGIKVYHLKKTQWEMYKLSNADPTAATTIRSKFRGFRLVFLQSGRVGKFHFQTMMITLITGVALLSLSTLVIDNVIFRFTALKYTKEVLWLAERKGTDFKIAEYTPPEMKTLQSPPDQELGLLENEAAAPTTMQADSL
eukprot:TRINITY_DN67589_c2_g1_i2.p1 TRINITY_DN67589_c2_g1~~TRINITY_DN67589_c2_g1_i2.p1  ORF type:complete len:294 (-),score=46.63 TRINITY_DN67589_c2_g1_i2:181-1062(-)